MKREAEIGDTNAVLPSLNSLLTIFRGSINLRQILGKVLTIDVARKCLCYTVVSLHCIEAALHIM